MTKKKTMKKMKCRTCQGDGKIMSATGDPQHPMQAITCPECKGKTPKEVTSGYKDGDYGVLCDFIMGKKPSA